MATVYLYKYREYIHLVQVDKNVPNINLPMIQYDTKVFKGVTNSIDFVIRNNDRKPIKITGYTLTAQIRRVDSPSANRVSSEVLLEKDLIITDERNGKAKLVLLPEEVTDWLTGFYQYTVRTTDQENQQELLFTDINKETWGTFELLEGIQTSIIPAYVVKGENFTPTPAPNNTVRYFTSALQGDAQSQRANGTHTIVVYTTNWKGKIWVEGSLSNQAPLPNEWFNIPIGDNCEYIELDETNNVGAKLINFSMNLYWLRVSYQPSSTNQGVFNRILYKS